MSCRAYQCGPIPFPQIISGTDRAQCLFKGKLAPEEGAVFMKALEVALNQLYEKDVPAGTSFVEEAGTNGEVDTLEMVTADDGQGWQETCTLAYFDYFDYFD